VLYNLFQKQLLGYVLNFFLNIYQKEYFYVFQLNYALVEISLGK